MNFQCFFRGILILQTLNAAWGKDQSKLFNNPFFSSRTILNATAFFGERKSDTSEWDSFFFFPFPLSPSIFSWDVVVPAKYFPSLDVYEYVFPFFPRIPSTTTTQHVEREGKCVKTLLHPPSLGFSSHPPGGKRKEEESGRSLIQYPSPPPLRAAATTDVSQPRGRETAAQGFFILATLLRRPVRFQCSRKIFPKKTKKTNEPFFTCSSGF